MLSKTSWFNRGILSQNIKSTGWIAIIYFLALLFALPIQFLMGASSDPALHYHPIYYANNLFGIMDGLQVVLMFIIPVFLGIFLYRYMQVKLSADYMFGLPMKRKFLFHQQFVFGIIVLVLPLFLIALILLLLSSFITVNEILVFSEIAKWFGTTLLMTLFVYVVTVFVGMFTGMSVMQGILTYILLFLPAGLTVLFAMNLKYYLYGFSMDYYLNINMEKIVPLARATQFGHDSLTALEVGVYILITVVLYVLSIIAYERRVVESATQAITFKGIRPVFLYGVTFCSMLVGGLYFGFDQPVASTGWMIFGYIATSIIGYYIALMILEKSWRVLHRVKGYIVFVGCTFILFMLVNIDVLGYEKNMPAMDEIEQIYFGDNTYYFYNTAHFVNDVDRPNYFYKEQENIENIMALHEKIIEAGSDYKANNRYHNTTIVYELKDGKRIVREYQNINLTDFEEYHKPIVDSMEYKINMNPLLREGNREKLQEITFQVHSLTNKSVAFSDQEKISELIEIIKDEIVNETYEQVTEQYDSWSTVSFYYREGQTISVPFKKSYSKVESWLKEEGKFDKARVTAMDVSHIHVLKNENRKPLHEYYKFVDQMIHEEREENNLVEITNEQQIEECLQNSIYNDRAEYIVIFYSKVNNKQYEIKTFTEENVPSFIKEKM